VSLVHYNEVHWPEVLKNKIMKKVRNGSLPFYFLTTVNKEAPCLLDTAFEDHHSPFLVFLP
jgi:hypothetical protein